MRVPVAQEGTSVEKFQRNEKASWKPGNVLYPAPPVLVSCGGFKGWKQNLITIAWAGNVCSDPPMLSISVRPERYSYDIINSTGEFVVNLPSLKLARAVDWCGVISGRTEDKFVGAGLKAGQALKVNSPIVKECPINIECIVKKSVELGSHVMFIAEVAAVQVSSELIDLKGKFNIEKSGLLVYAHGQYFSLGRRLGGFGFSVRKGGRKGQGGSSR
jgi:flavin reductase (DIM6/NTAB) family NADH-FMN oxidoreductase RutF